MVEKFKSIDALHESSSILFWTIILVSSQWHPTQSHLYQQLVAPHQSLLSTVVKIAIQSVQQIHALILLCHWPVPLTRQSEDPSWNYCGMVMNAAMQMGLHQPGSRSELYGYGYSNAPRTSTEIRTMTWMACFSISTRYVPGLGIKIEPDNLRIV